MTREMRPSLTRLTRDEDGFTVVEVLVAAVILVVGLLGTLTMLDIAAKNTVTDQGREAGTNLAREAIEIALGQSYDDLDATRLQPALMATPSLTSTSGGGTWTVTRRGVTYTLSATACRVDDRVDGVGSAALKASGFCSGSTQTDESANRDRNPDDLRRLTVTASWSQNGQDRTISQSSVVANPGRAAGPAVTSVTFSGSNPVTASTPTAFTFSIAAGANATRVVMAVDGTVRGEAVKSGSTWTWTWDTANLGDATYTVTAQAYDSQGRSRGAYPTTVEINRQQAKPPAAMFGGRNLRIKATSAGSVTTSSVVDLEWPASDDPDVFGYRVFRGTSTSNYVQVCETRRQTTADLLSCTDRDPPGTTTLYYGVVALDRDPATGAERQTTAYTLVTVTTDNDLPGAPTNLTATKSADNTVTLNCAAANPGNKGEPIKFYRVSRNGTGLDQRIGRTRATELSFVVPDPTSATNTYYVTAVDTKYGESNPTLGVVK